MSEKIQPGFAIWLTGLPASGKSTLARNLKPVIRERYGAAQILDSDELRHILTPKPTYMEDERDWFYSVITFLAELLTNNGVNVVIAATAPRRMYREATRKCIRRFAEVYVDCSPEVCRHRDPKGLWKRADKGEITNLPGADAQYEAPISPEAHVVTTDLSPAEAANQVLHQLEEQGFFTL